MYAKLTPNWAAPTVLALACIGLIAACGGGNVPLLDDGDMAEPTATATPSPTATATPEPTATATAAPSPTATATPEPTATATPLPTVTATPTPTTVATPSPSPTAVPSLPPVLLSARVAPGLSLDQVCFDANQNLQCDAHESAAVPDAQGQVQVLVPQGQAGVLLGKFQPSKKKDPVPPLRIAAPAEEGAVLSALNTVLSVRWLQYGGAVQQQQQELLEKWQFTPEQSWADVVNNSSQQPAWAELETAAQAALQQGFFEARDGAAPQTPGQALWQLAPALENALSRYTLGGGQGLMPSISVRTLGSETAHAIKPDVCAVASTVPEVRIDIEGGQEVIEKDLYLNANLHFVGAQEHTQEEVFATEIRGRGNLTWQQVKKPYKLKLNKKNTMLGMPSKNKHWILVANYLDQSLLKNSSAFCLSRQLALDWTPSLRPVELYMNGEYHGAYDMIEHIREDEERVNIGNKNGTLSNPDPNDGFFVEMDWRLGEDFYFYTGKGHAYTVKTDSSAAETAVIQAQVNDFEQRLYDRSNPNYVANLGQVLDLEAFIDYYLVNELMLNFDGYALSTFAHKPAGGKLRFGPVWDFDLSAGSPYTTDPYIWFLPNKKPTFAPEGTNAYIAELLEHPEMQAHVLARMQYLHSQVPQLNAFIAASAQRLDEAQARNYQRWDNLGSQSYAQRIQSLQNWMSQRSDWMMAQMEAGQFR